MRIIKNGLLAGLGWFFLHCLWVTWQGFQPCTAKADVAVVLGNTVFADGSLSPWLKGRVDKALELYRNGQVKKIFVSGGVGKSNYPEGDGMRNYLLRNGVNEQAIIVDNLGDNTYLTAKHYVDLEKEQQLSSAIVVTSFYHVARTKWITTKLAGKNIPGASSASLFWADWYGLTREFFAYYKYLLLY